MHEFSTCTIWVVLGVTQNFGFAFRPRGFLDTNMLVSVTQRSCNGGYTNTRPQREGVCDVIEYRLYLK